MSFIGGSTVICILSSLFLPVLFLQEKEQQIKIQTILMTIRSHQPHPLINHAPHMHNNNMCAHHLSYRLPNLLYWTQFIIMTLFCKSQLYISCALLLERESCIHKAAAALLATSARTESSKALGNSCDYIENSPRLLISRHIISMFGTIHHSRCDERVH